VSDTSQPNQFDRDPAEEAQLAGQDSADEAQTVIYDPSEGQEASDERFAAILEAEGGPADMAAELQTQAPADAADALETLEPADSAEVLHRMEEEAAAQALAHMEPPLAATVVQDVSRDEAARLVALMNPDDAADLLQALSKSEADEILRAMPRRAAARLGQLALYEPETAGGLMTTEFLRLRSSATVAEAIERIRQRREYLAENDIVTLFCRDDEGKIEGVVDLRALILAEPEQRVADIMDRDIIALRPDTDREEVADAFRRYHYLVLPVIDEDRRILGIVTVDDVLDIIHEEHTEDALKQVGAGRAEAVYNTLGSKLKARMPWLVVNLGTASLAAAVVFLFEGMVEVIGFLAVLMPVIANQAGNAGNQSLAVTLRGIVLGEVREERIGPLLLRETVFGFITGLATGVLLGGFVGLLGAAGIVDATWRLGLIAAIAMSGALALGCLLGAGIPILMQRLKFDPATASTIFLLMLTDMISFAAFLGLASLLRSWLLAG